MSDTENISLPNPFAAQAGNLLETAALDGLEREMNADHEKTPNFPPFYPIVYHSISNEIPQNYSAVVKFAFFAALSFTFFCIFQFIASFFAFTINNEQISPFSDIFLSFCILILLPLLLFYIQYYPFYCALRDEDDGKKDLIYVQIYVIIVSILILIGIPGTGCIGIWWTLIANKFSSSLTTMIGSIACIWEILNTVMQMALLKMMSPVFEDRGRIANPADI